MQKKILQDFLNLRLVDIGAEDARLEKLTLACDELANGYAHNPSSALPPLLAAWNPTASEDPSLLAIGQVVQAHWPTYRGAFQGEPLTLYRAIILQAVFDAMSRQGTLAVAVHLIGENVMPHLKVGREQTPLSNLLSSAKVLADARIAALWTQRAEPSQVTRFEAPTFPTVKKIEAAAWHTNVTAATGPHGRNGTALPAANPHWTNQPSHWSWEFADRMAPILADVHDKAAALAIRASAQAFKAYGDLIAKKLNESLAAADSVATQLNRASQLLWWRQALYSEVAAKPYRKLAPTQTAFYMAVDLAALLPEAYPAAVESLLYEAVRAIAGTATSEQLAMCDMIETLRQDTQLAGLDAVQALRAPPGSQLLLVHTLATSTAMGTSELPGLGVDPRIKLDLGDWAIWMLRELKALQALQSPDDVEAEEARDE